MDKLQQWRTEDKLTINFSLKYINNAFLLKIKGITMICAQICSVDFKLQHHQALFGRDFKGGYCELQRWAKLKYSEL